MVALSAEMRHEISAVGHISRPVEILPGLFQIVFQYPHRDAANVFLLTGRRPTLIDCGSMTTIPWLVGNLSQLGIAVSKLQIIITHGHIDHVEGFHGLLRYCPQLSLMIHPADLEAVVVGDSARTCSNIYRVRFKPIPEEACRPIVEGQKIFGGSQELEVFHLPGHSPGHIGLLGSFGGVSTLLTGDVIGGAINPDPNSGASLFDWRQTLDKILDILQTYSIEAVIPSHESPGDLPKSRFWCKSKIDRFGLMFNPWF